ncbi:MAG: alpha-L-fucosidase [Chitinophagaceae bacterium]
MRKYILFLLAGICLLQTGFTQPDFMNESPADRNARMQWWRDARFGMFIHWGLYAVPAGEWKGETKHAEWIRTTARIPLKEYDQFVHQFNPVHFNAETWVQMAKDAGMKYLTITSKHHDGFCLWDSKETDFDVMSTPFKRDILKELADACRKIGGVKLCFYHSIMDWHHPDYNERRDWEKDRPVEGTDRKRYIDYMKRQLKELLTSYGEIGVLWFDGEWEGFWTHEDGVDLYNYVRSLQPSIIINNRVDKGRSGMAGMNTSDGYGGDFGTPEQEIPETGLPGVDWESCMTMNNNWGYNKADKNFKSTKDLITKLIDIVSKGGNYLLNVGPMADGMFPQESVERLSAIGSWMKKNGESIYGSTASPFEHTTWGRITQKTKGNNTTLYLFAFDWPSDRSLALTGIANKPLRVYRVEDGSPLDYIPGENRIDIPVPPAASDSLVTVIAVELEGKPLVHKAPVIQSFSSEFIQSATATLSLPGVENRSEIRYTMNGTMPNKSSRLYRQPLQITRDTRLRAVTFYNNKPVSEVTEMKFTRVKAIASVELINPQPGLKVNYYEGDWDSLPVFSRLIPASTGVMNKISTGTYNGRERFGLVADGWIRLDKTDVYNFYLGSDDGSRLYIDDRLLVDNNGLHGMVDKKGTLALEAGYHQVRVEFFEKTGSDEVRLSIETESTPKMEVPSSNLFHR